MGEIFSPPNKIVQNVFDTKTLLYIFMNTVLKLYFKTIIIKYNAYFKSSKMSVQILC